MRRLVAPERRGCASASDGGGRDHVEGGMIVPFAVNVAEGIGLGLMFGTDFVRDEDGGRSRHRVHRTRSARFRSDASSRRVPGGNRDLQHRLRRRLSGHLRIGSNASGINENVVLDAGVDLRLIGDTDDISFFTGMTSRFSKRGIDSPRRFIFGDVSSRWWRTSVIDRWNASARGVRCVPHAPRVTWHSEPALRSGSRN